MPDVARIRITRIVDPDDLGAQILPKMEALGKAVGARAQRLVPKRTWALHDSITTETTRRGAVVKTTVSAGGGEVDYALKVERGTSKMVAQPYLRPAFLQTKSNDLRYSGNGPETRGVKRDRAKSSRERRKARATEVAPKTTKRGK